MFDQNDFKKQARSASAKKSSMENKTARGNKVISLTIINIIYIHIKVNREEKKCE